MMNPRIAIVVAAVLALPFTATAQDTTPASGPSSTRSSDIEIGDLIARYAKRTGRQIIIDPRVRAQVPLAGMDPNKIDYERLLAILSVHQFAAVTQGEWMVIVPDLSARQLPTPVYTERNFKAAPDEIVTLLVNVKNVCAAHAVPVLRPLMPQAAHMAAYVETNTLILNDHASNLHRLVTVIEALERAGERNPTSAAECQGQFESKSK
jgi:general secretion pathway protein D